jgi:hypothetical protein
MGLISNGTTVFDAGAMSLGGSMTFIKKLTASSSATLSFVNGASGVVLDSTYKKYEFHWVNCHPQTNGVTFQMNVSIDGGSNYNVAKTTTAFDAYHYEDDSGAALQYLGSYDLAQGTGFQPIDFCSNQNDQSSCGKLQLFNPGSTTFVKHFISTAQDAWLDGSKGVSQNWFTGGYANTTSAVNAVQFKFSSGNIDAGTISLYGIS